MMVHVRTSNLLATILRIPNSWYRYKKEVQLRWISGLFIWIVNFIVCGSRAPDVRRGQHYIVEKMPTSSGLSASLTLQTIVGHEVFVSIVISLMYPQTPHAFFTKSFRSLQELAAASGNVFDDRERLSTGLHSSSV
ncbi:hypothetical protein ACEPAH_1379 [Sanghuangporus vaninii]